MSAAAECPHCSTPLARLSEGAEPGGSQWSCPEHGRVPPLWRSAETDYDALVAHLDRAAGFPTYLPWPLRPGWRVTDAGGVGGGEGGGPARASYACVSGPSDLDGPVDVVIVAEEAGTGIGARVAGLAETDPGAQVAAQGVPPPLRVSLDGMSVGLWPLTVVDGDTVGDWDRSVLVGEGGGRWLWLVLRPASALLLLGQESNAPGSSGGRWFLRDVTALGPGLVELPFGGPGPAW